LIHTSYRLRVTGDAHFPESGAGLLVCNHVSYVDALIITAACRRPIRFVMYEGIYRLPVLNSLFRLMRVISIADPRTDRRLVLQAFTQIDQALAAGELVCIFPEGRLSDSGEMNPFKLGLERILARRPVPVIPMALRGLWGSFFSRAAGGKAMRSWPRKFWAPLELVVGTPLPPSTISAAQLHAIVSELRGTHC
jgi:1-acyl-sn-glycerol-3-phosphate acyltransferase